MCDKLRLTRYGIAFRWIFTLGMFVQAASTHPYWGQHTAELWARVLAGIKERLDLEAYKTVCDVLIDAWNTVPAQENAEAVQFELRLDHNCSAGACADGTCTLCVNSASRPCPQLLKSKYLLRDGIVPACGSAASVRITRSGRSGASLSTADFQALPPFIFQVCALPWAFYRDNKDNIPWDTIHSCKTITKESETASGPEIEAVLACRDFGHMETDGFISFPHGVEHAQGLPFKQLLAPNGVKLPEVFFPKRSAEALLDGKRPQLVLVVRAVHAHTGAPLQAFLPAASTPFHVATRRTRGNEKAYIPSMDQEVRVLEHIGDACIRKLKELPQHVSGHPEIALPASIPDGKVLTVAHMHAVVAAVENNKTAEKELFLKTLKLNDDRLGELKEQLKRAVRPDSELRVFYCGTYPEAPLPNLLDGPVDVGLVFTCTRGTVDLHEGGICGVVMRSQMKSKQVNGIETAMEAIVPRDHLIQEPQLKPLLLMHARRAWCTSGHPGWGFYTFQGRATARMPPENSPQYPVDPNKIPCFTPSQYSDAPEGGAQGGVAEAEANVQSTAVASAGATDIGTALQADQEEQAAGRARNLSEAAPAAARQPSAEEAGAAHRQAQEVYASMDAMHAAQNAAQHAAQQAAVETVRAAGAAHAAEQAAALHPGSPGAASAAATLMQAAAANRAAQQDGADGIARPALAGQMSLQLQSMMQGSAAAAASVAASAWMNTHELAAAAAGWPSISQAPPLSLFQPSGPVDATAGLVRAAMPGEAAGAPLHKQARVDPGLQQNPVWGTIAQPNAHVDATGGVTGSAGISFVSLGGLSGDVPGNPNPALVSSVLLSNGIRSAAPASSDLGSFLFSNIDSLPSGTPAGSIELAV